MVQTDYYMQQQRNKSGFMAAAAGFAFLVVVALALMSGRSATPPAPAGPAAQWPAAAPETTPPADAAAAAPASAEPTATASAPRAQPPAEIRAALEASKPATGSLVSRVYFASGSSALDEDGRASVQRAARTLSAGLAARVALSGYVDASGNAATNAELAKHRALAVREALLAAGVPAEAVELRKPQQITAGGSPDEARRVDLLLQR